MELLVNRRVCVCGTSPHVIFELYDNKLFDEPTLLGLCVLELKTKTTKRTATQLDNINVKEGNQFKCYRVGSLEVKQLVEEPTYCSQICQHACAKGLNYVMMVYVIPGGIIKRIAIIRFTNYQVNKLSTF